VEYPKGTWSTLQTVTIASNTLGYVDCAVNIPAFAPYRISGDVQTAGSGKICFSGWSNRPEAKAFLDWWLSISLEACEQAPTAGRYAEQGWLRFVGDFLDKVLILRDPSVNAAWWRIDSPGQVQKAYGRWMIDGVPLRLFHFSQIDFDDLESITVHQERVRGTGDLLRLYEEYRDKVIESRRSIVPAGTSGNDHADADTTT
jgi:hypothetical protein